MVIIKNKAQIDGIKASCQLAARTLSHVAGFLKPGITTDTLNTIAVDYIREHKAIAAPLNYHGYPKSICVSVNDVVCHGIPSEKQILKEGDIVNIDITTILNGYFGDVSATFPIGNISPEAKHLIEVTQLSLNQAIKSLKPGKLINDCVGKTIERIASEHGFAPVRELGGHGVGLSFHEDPFVYHFDNSRDKTVLKSGMIFTIEPMINGSLDWRVNFDKKDGWTVRTNDGSLSCQFEHTVLITDDGYQVLTRLK